MRASEKLGRAKKKKTNNRGSFLKTITMTVKGAKMCVIANPKCNPKFDMLF